jgi:two-component system cell cycle sensor histidine kinase/response regulator CckA
LRAGVEEIARAGERATGLTRQRLAFSRLQTSEARVLALDEVVAGMEKMLGRLLGEDIELAVCTGSSVGRVLADPSQIEQIVMNLAVNARDTMPRSGRLRIELHDISFD